MDPLTLSDTANRLTEISIPRLDQLTSLCAQVDTTAGIDGLQNSLKSLMPTFDFKWVLTRGNWHRLGGVVDADYKPVSDNITHWAERESAGDLDQLIRRFVNAGYFATNMAGKTHYFTFACSDQADDYMQLEIEELQEVLDRPLIDRDWFPDSLEEFLDPVDYPRLEPEPVGKAFYHFRRVTHVAEWLNRASKEDQVLSNLRRFLHDWNRSSASEGGPFCSHWILLLREYSYTNGECRLNARPVSTFSGNIPDLPSAENLQGAELAKAIHSYDRKLGYPFAWYFIMLSRKSANYELAEAVLRDQMGAYDYLPMRDLKVIRDWEQRPY